MAETSCRQWDFTFTSTLLNPPKGGFLGRTPGGPTAALKPIASPGDPGAANIIGKGVASLRKADATIRHLVLHADARPTPTRCSSIALVGRDPCVSLLDRRVAQTTLPKAARAVFHPRILMQ